MNAKESLLKKLAANASKEKEKKAKLNHYKESIDTLFGNISSWLVEPVQRNYITITRNSTPLRDFDNHLVNKMSLKTATHTFHILPEALPGEKQTLNTLKIIAWRDGSCRGQEHITLTKEGQWQLKDKLFDEEEFCNWLDSNMELEE